MRTQKKKDTTKFYGVDYKLDPFAERLYVQSFSRKKNGWTGALGRPVYRAYFLIVFVIMICS